ncbi:rhodanese-like domain-containing protein [Chloroflexota bacterium]
MGRFTLPELFGLPTGWVVLGVILMALFMFWGAEKLEKIIGKKEEAEPKWRLYGAGGLILVALAGIAIGQPTNADRWGRIAAEKDALLTERAVYIHPGELLHTLHDHKLDTVMIDVRSEADYNLFHIADSQRVDIDDLIKRAKDYNLAPENTVFVVMSNDEAAATEAWKILVAESIPNVYILEGGINGWLDTFAHEEDDGIEHIKDSAHTEDSLRYTFVAALGASFEAADPHFNEWEKVLEYTPKIKLQRKTGPSGGGCG